MLPSKVMTPYERAINGRGFWEHVGRHVDSYSAIMQARRGSFIVNKPIVGLDGGSGTITMTDADDGLLLLGPAGSGKSSSAIIVNALMAPGPMFSSTSRSDVYLATALARARIGRVWHLSTSGKGLPGAYQLRFSPLTGCENFEYAQEVAKRFADYRDMGTSARTDHGGHPHFRERAGTLLAILFHYAAIYDHDMEWVVSKVAPANPLRLAEVVARLQVEAKSRLLSDMLEGLVAGTAPQEMAGVMSTATRALNCYTTQAALRTTRDPNFNFKDFVRGKPFESSRLLRDPDSLPSFNVDSYESIGMGRYLPGVFDSVYVTEGNSESPTLPIFLEFIFRVREAADEYAEECRLAGKPIPIPTTLILDELAAMPIPDIGRMLADARDRAVMLCGGVQSLAQARDLYGKIADDFLTLWRCTMAFPGIQDRDTLELLSLLSGTYWHESQGWSESRNPRTHIWEWTSNVSQTERPRLSPDEVRRGHPMWRNDGALLVRRDQPHMWVRAVRYFQDPWARVLVNSSEHAREDGLMLPLPVLAKDGNYSHLERLGLADRFRALQSQREIEGLCGGGTVRRSSSLSITERHQGIPLRQLGTSTGLAARDGEQLARGFFKSQRRRRRLEERPQLMGLQL